MPTGLGAVNAMRSAPLVALAGLLLLSSSGCIAPAPRLSPPPRAGPTPPDVPCAEEIPILLAGAQVGAVCRAASAAQGLTTLDLSDDWRPLVLTDDPTPGEAGAQPYAATYLALASGRFGAGPEWDDARDDRYLELYGIFPTFTALRERLSAEARHRCHASLVQATLAPTGALGRAALLTVQQHLICDGLLARRATSGRLDPRTLNALARFQRKHMIIGRGLDRETRAALGTSSRELDLRALLRTLRVRVADATGIIEDGSARGERGLVAGRALEARAFLTLPSGPVTTAAAPDLLSQATDAAAQALGFTDPQAALTSFTQHGAKNAAWRVAVRLPSPPPYHTEHMELRAEIDRGDVWYDYPYSAAGREVAHRVSRHPTLTVYVKPRTGGEVALVRWPTTIGGWQVDKLRGGGLGYRYKASDVGPRVWRDVVASPAWLPPPSTPDKELVRRSAAGRWVARESAIGPGYRSAFGLVMMIHDEVSGARAAKPVYTDLGIRTHGSASYTGIAHDYSHGCHRLFNHLAVRLASFLLRHRVHVRHGDLRTDFARALRWRGQHLALKVASRGYRYELTPPVPVEVLPGTIQGAATRPITRLMALPRDKAREYRGQPER